MSDTPTLDKILDKILDERLATQIELLNLKSAVADFCQIIENFQTSSDTARLLLDAITESDKFQTIKNLSK